MKIIRACELVNAINSNENSEIQMCKKKKRNLCLIFNSKRFFYLINDYLKIREVISICFAYFFFFIFISFIHFFLLCSVFWMFYFIKDNSLDAQYILAFYSQVGDDVFHVTPTDASCCSNRCSVIHVTYMLSIAPCVFISNALQ